MHPLARAANMPDEIKSWDRNGAGDLEAYPHYSQNGSRNSCGLFGRRIRQGLKVRMHPSPHITGFTTPMPRADAVKYGDGKIGRSPYIVHTTRFWR